MKKSANYIENIYWSVFDVKVQCIFPQELLSKVLEPIFVYSTQSATSEDTGTSDLSSNISLLWWLNIFSWWIHNHWVSTATDHRKFHLSSLDIHYIVLSTLLFDQILFNCNKQFVYQVCPQNKQTTAYTLNMTGFLSFLYNAICGISKHMRYTIKETVVIGNQEKGRNQDPI